MRRLHLLLLGGALATAACSSASGDVAGGDLRFDAAVPTASADAGVALCFAGTSQDGGADGGVGEATWTGLYNDYFGGAATSGCGVLSGCHGAANQAGALASSYICPPNDKDACYAGITGSSAGLIDPANPEGSGLFLVLRKTTAAGTNKMPRSPVCSFSDADMKRITDWMRAGANND